MILALPVVVVLSAAPPPNVGISDFTTQGASKEFAGAVNALVTHELERLGTFTVVSADTVRTLLGNERQRQILGGSGGTAGVDLADLTAFDSLITGQVAKVGSGTGATYTLSLSLLDIKASRQINTSRAEAASEAGLLNEVPKAVVKLVGKLLEGRRGHLVVASSEAGATVKVDDTTVGTTPLDGRISIAAGPHFLQLDKDGFVSAKKEVRVNPDAVTEETLNLVPSPDTIQKYESSAGKMRAGAIVATGLAVAGLATFIAFEIAADDAYGSVGQNRSFEWYRNELNQGRFTDADGIDNRAEAQKLAQQIGLYQTLAYVGIGVGGAAAVAATFLWIFGDQPGKYTRYREKVVGPVKASLTPTLNGGALVGTF